jgi:putative ATP-binding protein
MYYPYFRGKQFELIAIRESANTISGSGFVPIIEPVRESLSGVNRALRSLTEVNAEAIVIINPRHGDYRENGDGIVDLLEHNYRDGTKINAGILLTNQMDVNRVTGLIKRIDSASISLIHAGFTDPRTLSANLADEALHFRNIFLEDHTNLLYRKNFHGKPRVLVGDGFIQMKNADYPLVEPFSDLHITFREQDMDGYGDFLTVGDNYSEGGGPAYAVAIHMTFIDPDQDNAMFIYHFKSDTNDVPTDPAGKFSEALNKLISALNSGNSHLLETSAVHEFRELHARGHFPGLGYVKKLSIKHHLETLATYHVSAGNA